MGSDARVSGDAAAAIAVRAAEAADAVAISALVSRLTRTCILPQQPPGAADKLLAWMAADAIAQRIASGHRYHVAEIGAVLAGVVAIRDDAHLYLLFVDTPFQRRGIARALWQRALAACAAGANPKRITVNASAFAVPVYCRLGFVALRAAEMRDGIITTPMEYCAADEV